MEKVSTMMNQDYASVGGIDSVVEILNAVDRGTEKNILETLEVEDVNLADEIRNKMFVFEDIVKLDNRSIQRILRDVDNSTLAVALKGSSEQVKDVVLANVSKRLAEMVVEEIQFMGPVRLRDVEEAQQKIVAIIRKLEDAKKGVFRQFAYVDYIKFILYNIRDVVVQLAIEFNVNDCKTLMSRSYTFATQFPKCFKETHIVRNCREYYYEKAGFIQSCRLIDDSGCDTAFKGAYVAPPEKNAYTGEILNGKPVNNIIYAALDADAKAYYPSTKCGMNMNGMTLLYKCRINVESFIQNICYNRSFNQESYWYDNPHPPRQHEEDFSGPILNTYKNKKNIFLCVKLTRFSVFLPIFAIVESPS